MEIAINKELISDKKLCRALAVATLIILTALSAFVRIPLPFTPVPLTLQTFFVLLGAALLGRKLGTIAQAVYLVLGFTGLQVFTGAGSGSLYLLGPTGGYIAGFIGASFFVGNLLSRGKNSPAAVFVKFLAADFIILFSGTLWLKMSLAFSWEKAFFLGFVPFVLGDILKITLATAVYSKISARIKVALY
jgi:biotin transport system substrate-specific component